MTSPLLILETYGPLDKPYRKDLWLGNEYIGTFQLRALAVKKPWVGQYQVRFLDNQGTITSIIWVDKIKKANYYTSK